MAVCRSCYKKEAQKGSVICAACQRESLLRISAGTNRVSLGDSLSKSTPEDNNYKCVGCGFIGHTGEACYLVRVITAAGNAEHVPACSVECAEKVKEMHCQIHLRRAEEVRNGRVLEVQW